MLQPVKLLASMPRYVTAFKYVSVTGGLQFSVNFLLLFRNYVLPEWKMFKGKLLPQTSGERETASPA